MFSKSKLKKLGTQLKKFGVTTEEQAVAAGIARVTLYKLYRGQYYDGAAIKNLIELRDKKLLEATELETAI